MHSLPTSAARLDAEPRAIPYTGKSFTAFRITDSPARTYPVRFDPSMMPTKLETALTAALTGPTLLCHKEKLLIRETDDAGKTTLHLYAIKRKSNPDFVREGFETRRVQRLYAEKVCEIDGSVFHG